MLLVELWLVVVHNATGRSEMVAWSIETEEKLFIEMA